MIYAVEGELTEKLAGRVVVDVAGLSYEVLVPDATVEQLGPRGSRVRLLTHLSVREDAWTLFGFRGEDDREVFRLLLGVQGVGPRVALAILSGLPPSRLRAAIVDSDVAALKAIAGVGKKTAERVIVDLRDKVGATGLAELPGTVAPAAAVVETDDAVDALVALGYSRSQSREAVHLARQSLDDETAVPDVVRDALRRL